MRCGIHSVAALSRFFTRIGAGILLSASRSTMMMSRTLPSLEIQSKKVVPAAEGAAAAAVEDPNLPFCISLRVRWSDTNGGQHMRNAAFLGSAEDCRMSFLSTCGFTMSKFDEIHIRPEVLEDKLMYKKELLLQERYRVELTLSAASEDGRKMKARNSIVRESDGVVCVVVESSFCWMDLRTRKLIVPPKSLKDAWLSLSRTEDFYWLQ